MVEFQVTSNLPRGKHSVSITKVNLVMV